MLLHTPETIVAALLTAEGVGTEVPTDGSSSVWPVYVGFMPDQPEEIIACSSTQGKIGGRTGPDLEMREYFGLQLMLRARTHTSLSLKLHNVSEFCDRVDKKIVTLDSTQYLIHTLSRQGTPLTLGRDSPKSARVLGSINLLATLKRI